MLIVLEDLRLLWNEDLGGKLLGAVPDYPRVPRLAARERLTALGLPVGQVYVNSGVLVIDLVRWRQGRLSERLFEFIAAKGSALYAYDQDAINAVLASRDPAARLPLEPSGPDVPHWARLCSGRVRGDAPRAPVPVGDPLYRIGEAVAVPIPNGAQG